MRALSPDMAVRKIKGSWWVDIRVAGRRHRVKCVDGARSDAMQLEARLRRDLHLQAVRAGEAPLGRQFTTLSEFADGWMELYVRQRNKPSEQRNKGIFLRKFILPLFGHLKPESVSVTHVEQLVASLRSRGLGPKSINNVLMTLSKLLRTAQEWGVIAHAPKVRLLKAPPPAYRFLEPFESARLLQAAGTKTLRAMILLALRTGLRISEIIALTWENVDLPRQVVHVRQALVIGVLGTPKSNRERHVPLAEDAAATLRELGPSTGWVFRRNDGRVMSDFAARHLLYKACDRAGIPRVGWHTLRHTCASQLVGLNAPLRNVQELLGHASLEMTMRYSHVSAHALQATVAMLDRLEERERRIVPNGHQSGHQTRVLAEEGEGSTPPFREH